jgi:hypothetical protein
MEHKHAILAAWIFGSLLLVFLMAVALLIPDPTHGQMSLFRFFMALLAAFFSYFFVGHIALRGRILGQSVGAGGGFALFVLVQVLDPFAIRSAAGDYLPQAVRPDVRLKDAQEDLHRLKLLPKEPDGIRDSPTTLAIRLFQAQNSLPTDGALSPRILQALKVAVIPAKSVPALLPDPTPASSKIEDLRAQPAPTATKIERPRTQETPAATVEATSAPRLTERSPEGVFLDVVKSELEKSRVEVKCLVPEKAVASISIKLGLASKVPLTRVVCFFDSSSLDLFNGVPKLILRSRYDSSTLNESDTTVKVRDGKVKGDDVECEFDKVCGRERTESCSVTSKNQKLAEIQTANAGKDIKKIFSKKQEAVAVRAFVRENVSWDELQPYGPVQDVYVWKKIEIPGGPPLTVERWDLPPRPGKPARVLFEVSAKVPLSEEAKTSKWIADFLGLSADGGGESETKTRIVLEHFADHSP